MSLHFSVITPAPGREREAAHDWVGGPYAEHQWLWQKFFPAPNGSARDFLFRRWDTGGAIRFYVVSQRAPLTNNRVWRVQTRDYAPKLRSGMRLHFDLRANPSVASRRDGKLRRHDVVMSEKKRLLSSQGLDRWSAWQGVDKPDAYSLLHRACTRWLLSRAEMNGFQVEADVLTVDAYERHSCSKRAESDKVCFTTVDFSGELTVTDARLFEAALCRGIGRAKAFGCGLVLVRPAGLPVSSGA